MLAAHGTRNPAGEAALAALAARVRAGASRAPRRARATWRSARRCWPSLPAASPGPVVVVPLLLAGGYHVHVDLPGVVARARPDALVARPLGPHPLLTTALARRLARAGLRAADAVVLGAAGSSDPRARDDVRAAARLLAVRLARPVTAAFLSGGRARPRPDGGRDAAPRPGAPRGGRRRTCWRPASSTAPGVLRRRPGAAGPRAAGRGRQRRSGRPRLADGAPPYEAPPGRPVRTARPGRAGAAAVPPAAGQRPRRSSAAAPRSAAAQRRP